MLVSNGTDELTLTVRPVLECDDVDEVAVKLLPVLLVWPVLVSDDTDEVTVLVWLLLVA